MGELAKIIPLAPRRKAKPPGRGQAPGTQARATPSVGFRRRWLAIFWAGLLGTIVSLLILDRSFIRQDRAAAPDAVWALPPPARRGLYETTVGEIGSICALPAAQSGVLRRHCVEQARFVRQLPECTGDCARLTGTILSRYR